MAEHRDWTGNSRSAHTTLGARNYALNEREVNDYYATEPKAAHLLMAEEQFSPMIWECACGEGHLAREFEKAGYHVYSTDLIDRGFGGVQDFLTAVAPPPFRGSILSQTRLIHGRLNLWTMLWRSSTMVIRSLCSSNCNFLKVKPAKNCSRNGHRKPYMSVAAACIVL